MFRQNPYETWNWVLALYSPVWFPEIIGFQTKMLCKWWAFHDPYVSICIHMFCWAYLGIFISPTLHSMDQWGCSGCSWLFEFFETPKPVLMGKTTAGSSSNAPSLNQNSYGKSPWKTIDHLTSSLDRPFSVAMSKSRKVSSWLKKRSSWTPLSQVAPEKDLPEMLQKQQMELDTRCVNVGRSSSVNGGWILVIRKMGNQWTSTWRVSLIILYLPLN